MRSIFVHILVIVLCSAGLASAQVEVAAELQNNIIRMGEIANLEVTVTVKSTDINPPQPEMPTIPGLSFGFYKAGAFYQKSYLGPGGFVSQASRSYIYQISATKPGSYDIKGIKATAGNQTATAPPVSLTVLEAPQQQNAEPSHGDEIRIDPSRMDQYGIQFDLRYEQNTYYIGQPIPIKPTFVYPNRRAIQIEEYNLDNKFPGCLVKSVPDSRERARLAQPVNGNAYVADTIETIILYPLAPGQLKIEPIPISYFVGGRYRSMARSAPFVLNVLDVPTEGRPEDFSGAVGTFQLEAGVDLATLEVGQALTLSVTLVGEGNIDQLPPPKLPSDPAFERYEPSTDIKSDLTRNGTVGRVRYEVLMVPREEGEFDLGKVSYVFFDPHKEKFVRLESKPIRITVTPATGHRGERIALSGGRREIELSGEDFRHIATGPKTGQAIKLNLYAGPIFILVLIFPAVLLVGAWVWHRRALRLAEDEGFARTVRAPKAAQRLLKDARSLLEKDVAEAGALLEKTLTDYIADRWTVPARGITSSEVEKSLSDVGVSPEIASDIRQLLEDLARSRYAASPDNDGMAARQLYQRTEDILGALMKVKS